MKNVKLILLAVTAMLFLGMGNASAQVSSVMINGSVNTSKIYISILSPTNERTEKEYNLKDKNFDLVLKEELDKWLLQGYEIVDSSVISNSLIIYRIIYVLIKKE